MNRRISQKVGKFLSLFKRLLASQKGMDSILPPFSYLPLPANPSRDL